MTNSLIYNVDFFIGWLILFPYLFFLVTSTCSFILFPYCYVQGLTETPEKATLK